MRIARNSAINHINSKSSRMQKNIQTDDNLVYISDPANQAGKLELLDLKETINKLDPRYQVVPTKICFEGFTHRDLSDELDISLGMIKSRLNIALRELKTLYEFKLSSITISGFLIFSISL